MNRKTRPVALAAILTTAALTGCEEKDCNELSQSACEHSSKCVAVVGTELKGGKTRPLFVGCDPAGTSCGDVLTCAQDFKTKRVAYFTNTCIGPGWAPINSNKCDAIRAQLYRERATVPDSGDEEESETDAGDSD